MKPDLTPVVLILAALTAAGVGLIGVRLDLPVLWAIILGAIVPAAIIALGMAASRRR